MYQAILSGINRGVNRHWRFAKNMLQIRPEYLLTVSVADELTNGACGIDGLDLLIKLEEPTKSISFNLLRNAIGLRAYFKAPKHKCVRKGKVDIFVEHDSTCWIIELKGFDPSVAEINKDIVRLVDFLSVNDWRNNCLGAYLAFPTLADEQARLESMVSSLLGKDTPVSYVVFSHRVDTGESPEDGIPSYHANCIALKGSSVAGVQPNHAKSAPDYARIGESACVATAAASEEVGLTPLSLGGQQ